jgi:hypothetical protein
MCDPVQCCESDVPSNSLVKSSMGKAVIYMTTSHRRSSPMTGFTKISNVAKNLPPTT